MSWLGKGQRNVSRVMQDKECQTVRENHSKQKVFCVGSPEFLASRVRHVFQSGAEPFRRVVVLATAALCASIVAFPTVLPLRVNLSRSEPLGVYRAASSSTVHRGSLVGLCFDRELVARRYVRRGSCPNGLEPVLKQVVAEEGDVVDTSERSVRINGRELEASATSRVDSFGQTLEHFPWGRRRLSPGELWLFSSRPRSWDSRYFGPRRMEEVVAVVEPLFTFD